MRKTVVFIAIASFVFLSANCAVYALSSEEEIHQLKEQVKVLIDRIEKLEGEVAATKAAKPEEKVAEKKEEPVPAMLAKVGTNLKISGRWAAGYFDSQENGSFSNGSFQAPEAKLRFDFAPDKINTIVMRMSLNNATFNNLDYFYVDSKGFLKFLDDTPFTLESRLGKLKFDYGEETWSNNIVESALISNSSANAAGYDEGLQLSGKIKMKPAIKWSAAVMNGNTGTGADNDNSKAFAGKLGVSVCDPLYLSASYYDSGDLVAVASEASIAGITSAPTNATNWRRKMWEVDARYDFGKGKKPLDPPAYTDSKAYIKLAYGQFADDTEDGNKRGTQDRDGDYGFVEGLYNINPKLYGAYRYSFTELDDNVRASLNSINANKHERHSLGFGWRWSDKTLLKGEYSWNEESDVAAGTGDKNDQISGIISSLF